MICTFKLDFKYKLPSHPVYLIVTVLLLLSTLFISSCSKSHSDIDKTIRFGLSNTPVTFDPRYATDAVSSRINRLIYQRLVDFDEQTKVIPSLASWQQLSPIHYRFKLINASQFHHGKQLTMRDVKATYENVLTDKKISPHRNSIKHIKRIDLLDDNTLDFHLSHPDSLFPSLLLIAVLPADLLEKQHTFNTRPVGSGQFKFIEWSNDQLLKLKRIKDKQLFEFVSVKDPTVRILKLLRGELDIIQNNLPTEQIDYLKNHPDIRHQQVKGSNYSYIGFNLKDPMTKNHQLRKAIAHAINRDEIIHYLLGDAAVKANGFFPDYHWVANNSLKEYGYDPKLSISIIKSLGYDQKKPLKLTFKTSSNPFSIRKATIIQNQLKQVGIDVIIQSYDWGTFYSDIKQGKFQLYSLEWVGIKSPDIYNYVFHSNAMPPKGANRGRLNNPQIDKLIEQADSAVKLSDKIKYYQQLQTELHQLLPYVSLWYMSNISFYRANISGYKVYKDGIYDGLLSVIKRNVKKVSGLQKGE
jgi:peptide/nickel transport system substrate-binding protein